MNEEDTSTNTQGAHTPPTEPVAAGQVLILTGDPGDKAIALLPDGQELAVATIREDAAQAAFVVPRGCGRVRLDCADRTRCSLVAAPASFSAALFGSSAGGGGSTPVLVPGQKIVTENPPDKILRHGEIYHFPFTDNPINCGFDGCSFDDATGRVITCEIWVDTGYCAPPIDFNAGWQWVGVVPQMDKINTSYRMTVRKAPGYPPELNYAYCVPIPQPS